MPIYKYGQNAGVIYSNGKFIKEAYSHGKLVFSIKTGGWVMGEDLTMTISAANNNSVAGTMVFNRFDYYEGANITQTYYQLSTKSLSRQNEGVVTLNIGVGSTITFVNANQENVEYTAEADGTITLSALELYYLYKIKSPTILNLGTAMSVTSNYLDFVQDMGITKLGTSIHVPTGWAIANNRTSRMAVTTAFSVDYASLAIPGDGYWPVYAVANAGTEVTVSTITCATNAHEVYDSKNIRHLGWVTVSGGAIASVTPFYTATGANQSNAVSGAAVSISPGYVTDTDGMRVYIPDTIRYDFTDMVTAAKDTTTTVAEVLGTKQTIYNNEKTATSSVSALTNVNMWASGSKYFNYITTTTKRNKVTIRLSNTKNKVAEYRVQYSKYNGTQYATNNPYTETFDMNNVSGNSTSARKEFYMPKNSTIYNVQASWYGSSSSAGNTVRDCYWYPVNTEASTTTTQGKTQTRTLYAKIVRNQNNNTITVTTQTTTGDSTPFVSYAKLGTITVARNASTGTFA